MLHTVPPLWKNKEYRISPSAYRQTFSHPAARAQSALCRGVGRIRIAVAGIIDNCQRFPFIISDDSLPVTQTRFATYYKFPSTIPIYDNSPVFVVCVLTTIKDLGLIFRLLLRFGVTEVVFFHRAGDNGVHYGRDQRRFNLLHLSLIGKAGVFGTNGKPGQQL